MRVFRRAVVKRIITLFVAVGLLAVWSGCRMIKMPLKSFRGALPEMTGEQMALREELRRHVEKLGAEIGERNVLHREALNTAAHYIEGTLATAGYQVTRQSYDARGHLCDNLQVEIRGKTKPGEIIIVGAHYDSVIGSPGANDNGTGIAGVLSLARRWADRQPARTLRFVAFVNEEPPYFQTPEMGSLVYAKECQKRGESVIAMLSLETMGCFSTVKGSQKYPFPLGMFYPSQGDFIAFVGNRSSSRLVRRCVKLFRERASFPSEGAALPENLPGIGWSDHWAFWQADYPALMVTDTAPFRYPHYHTAQDTPDKIDYDRLARVVDGLDKVLEGLTNEHSD